MIKLLKSNTPLVYAFAILLVLVFSVKVILIENLERFNFFDWYTSFLRKVVSNKPLDYSLTIAMLLLIGYFINRAFNKTSFYQKTTGFPIFLFLILLSTFGGFYFETSYVIDLILSLVFIRIIDLDQNKSAIHIGFKSGILLGVAFLFSYWVIPVGLLIFFSLSVFRPFYWREWLVSLIGMAIPVTYLISFQYLMYSSYNIFPKTLYTVNKVFFWHDYLSYGLLILIVFIALIKLRKHLTYISNIERKQVNILMFFTFLTCTISMLIFFIYHINYIIFIVPLTLLLSIPILNSNSNSNKVLDFLLSLLLVLNLFRIFVF